MGKIIVLIQGRTDSKRFPRKVLALIEKKPMIWHVIHRVQQVPSVQQIALLTTDKKEDKILLKIAKSSGIIGFSGSPSNVLERYYKTALKYQADPIVRITGDCPLIDPKVVEKMIRFFLENDYDYVSNTLNPTFPDGFDVEVFSFKTLEEISNKAKLESEREHVTTYIKNNIKKFKVYNFTNKEDVSRFRLTVDEKQDLKLIRKIYAEMRPKTIFYLKDVLRILSKKPKLLEINKKFKRNEGYLNSLKKDKV